MKFKATDEQVKQLCANAVQASRPAGMGFLHFDPLAKFEPQDFQIIERRGSREVRLDYVGGRMVKLSMREVAPGMWDMQDDLQFDYQSWSVTYATPEEFVKSVGAEVVQ